MNGTAKYLGSLFVILVLTLSTPAPVLACAACFGDSDSDMANGLKLGVLSLLAVVVMVLVGFAAFFVFLVRRSNLAQAPAASSLASMPPTAVTSK